MASHWLALCLAEPALASHPWARMARDACHHSRRRRVQGSGSAPRAASTASRAPLVSRRGTLAARAQTPRGRRGAAPSCSSRLRPTRGAGPSRAPNPQISPNCCRRPRSALAIPAIPAIRPPSQPSSHRLSHPPRSFARAWVECGCARRAVRGPPQVGRASSRRCRRRRRPSRWASRGVSSYRRSITASRWLRAVGSPHEHGWHDRGAVEGALAA